MRFLRSWDQISRSNCETRRNQNECEKNRNHFAVSDVAKSQADAEFFRILQLL
jgi:hypothetical protein